MKTFAKKNWFGWNALYVVPAIFVVAGLSVLGQSARADGAGNADVLPNSGCIQDVAGFNLGCTANDVNLGVVTNIIINDPCTVEPGDTVTFTGDFQMNLTAQARHDVGLYFASDGDGNDDGALTGICTAVTPAYAPDPPFIDLDGTTDTFPGTNVVSNIQDTCGDIDANHNPLLQTITLTVMCIDDDGDGMLDLPYCSSWRQPGGNDLCLSPTDAFPGAPSKCKCDDTFSVDVPVPYVGTIEVIKDVVPNGDDGKFNLQIDGIDEFVDAMDMDSTGPVMVSAGTSLDPEPPGPFALHTVGETAGTDTSLGDYDSSITCSDGVDSVGPVAGAGPVELTVEGRPGGASDAWVCTITNTRKATLELVKVVTNNNGGTAVETDWTLSAASGPTPIMGAGGVGPSEVGFGTYMLSESGGPTGYTASDWSCTGGMQNGAEVTIGAGDVVTCTITNDDDVPSLTLTKIVDNDNGGTAVATDFTLTADGPTPISGAGGASSDATFDAGTYDLSETPVAGYTASAWSCSGGTQNGAQITVGLGESASCTITNTDDPISLTLVKVVDNDNGGTAMISDFALTANGNAFTSGVAQSVSAGSFNLAETGPAGYTGSDWVCVGGTQDDADTVTLGLGESATCTITNTDDPVSLTLVKELDFDNGGTAVVGDFALTANGNVFTSGDAQSVSAGSFDLAETGPAGYTGSDWVCVGGTQDDADTVTLALGESATCTITNTDDPPKLTLVKIVDNDNGGTAVAGDWTLSASGPTGFSGQTGVMSDASFDQGTYDLSETGPSGYSASDWVCDDGQVDGDTVEVGLGDDITCTITNEDNEPSLVLEKFVINDNGGTAVFTDFTLTADGPTPISGDGGASSGAGFSAGTYDLSETTVPGYSASAWSCAGGTQNGAQITLALGESATCSITNDDVPPSLTLTKVVENDNGGDAVATDFTLTADGPTPISGAGGASSDATFSAGSYDLSETDVAGYTASAWSCTGGTQNGAQISLGLGESASCTITNTDDAPKLTLVKMVENGANPGGTAVATDWTLTAAGPTGFSGQTGVMSDASFDQGSYDLSETGPAGYTPSDWVCVGGTQDDGDTISLGLGEEATCTITNTAQGMVDLLKLTNGVENQVMMWNFSLTGPGVDENDSSPPTTVDFGGVKLMPGGEYTLCETGIPAGWTLEWQVDTDGDGVPDTIIPMVAGVNNDPVGPDGYSRVYDPNYVPPPGQFTNDTRCVNFVVDVGETLAFQIDNQFPGGEPRTIGYWKNWNTCTNGNQPDTAAANGGPAAGWFILNDLLNSPGYTIGILQLGPDDCENAVNILDKRDISSGKKMASDAAYGLAAQLLAAQLNLSAGAETCMDVVTAVNDGQSLLASIDFDGTGKYLKGKNASSLRAEANALAATLDEYNNGNLCSP